MDSPTLDGVDSTPDTVHVLRGQERSKPKPKPANRAAAAENALDVCLFLTIKLLQPGHFTLEQVMRNAEDPSEALGRPAPTIDDALRITA